MKHIKEQYEHLGVAVIPNVFSKEEMKKLKSEAYKTKPLDIKKAGYPHNPEEKQYNKRSLIFFPALANEYINKIRIDERLVSIVRYFLGDNVKQINNQIYFREAGDLDEFAWHQDIIFRKPEDRFPNVEQHYMQTIIAVDDITIENGSIEFIEKSHLEGNQYLYNRKALTEMLRKFERKGLQGKKYEVKAGSVMIWNVLTVHGSEANRADQDRMTYMNGFCRAEGSLDYPWYLQNGELIEEINPELIP